MTEAECSLVIPARSDAGDESAELVHLWRRQHGGSETGARTTPRLSGVSGRACGEGVSGRSGRPALVPKESVRYRPTKSVFGAPPGERSSIRENLENCPDARAGVGGAHSSEEALVMRVDAKGLYFGEATGEARGHPIRCEA